MDDVSTSGIHIETKEHQGHNGHEPIPVEDATSLVPVLPGGPVGAVHTPPPTAPAGAIAGRNCPLCGGAGRVIGEREGVDVRECCGALLSWAWGDDEGAYERFYADLEQFHTGRQHQEGFPPAIERDPDHLQSCVQRLKFHSAIIDYRHARVLDIGAGTGAYVGAVCAAYPHATCQGLELCGDLVDWARTRGRPLKQGVWNDAEGSWDVIVMLDVLEHLTRPQACLTHLRSCLAEHGRLIVELPEWDGPHARYYGVAWRHIRPLQHLWLPSRRAAEALFERVGLSPIAWYRPRGGEIGKCAWVLGTW